MNLIGVVYIPAVLKYMATVSLHISSPCDVSFARLTGFGSDLMLQAPIYNDCSN